MFKQLGQIFQNKINVLKIHMKVSSFEETVGALISKINQIESLFIQIQKYPFQKNLIREKYIIFKIK